MYYEYWGLHKPPFDNVPDPSMYVDAHASVETAVAETLFAIEEGGECIAVIVGEIGAGKTLSLRLILDALDQARYRIALITNPATTFVQLLRDTIGQLTGEVCKAARKADLLEMFNRLLFEAAAQERKVLVMIDEANALSPDSLEGLRLLTNMQDDSRNLFTLVLAGQMELAKRLEHPRRANLFQRIGAYNCIEKIESPAVLKEYVRTRLTLAGASRMFFTDAAVAALWEQSEHGVPRLVNRICKLSMKAGETNSFNAIDEEVVNQIGGRFQRLTRQAVRPRPQRPARTVTPSPAPGPAADRKAEAGRLNEATGDEAAEVLPEAATPQQARDVPCEADIGSLHVTIDIPAEVLRQASVSTEEAKVKIAGSLAAKTLQSYPDLAFSSAHDPVSLWSDVRRSILNVFEEHARTAGTAPHRA